MGNIEIRITGMSCAGCVAAVTRKLQTQPGIANVEVQLQPGLARVSYDPAQTSVAALENAIEEAGFDVIR